MADQALASFYGAGNERRALAGCVGGQAREQTVLTPGWFVDQLVTSAGEPLALDPCTTEENPLGARVYATEDTNGLEQPWHLVTRPGAWGFFYCNPPYDALERWLTKCRAEMELGARGYLLGPARAHREWFPELVRGLPVLNLRPLKFEGHKQAFPEGLCVVVYGLPIPTILDYQYKPRKGQARRSMVTSVTSYGLQFREAA